MWLLGLVTGILLFLSPFFVLGFGLVMIYKSLDEIQERDEEDVKANDSE